MISGTAGECACCQLRQLSMAQSWLCRQNSSLFPLKDTTGCCALLLVKCSRLPVESLTCFTLAIRLSLQRACIQWQQWTHLTFCTLDTGCSHTVYAHEELLSLRYFTVSVNVYFLELNSLLCGLRWQINIAYIINSTEIIVESVIISQSLSLYIGPVVQWQVQFALCFYDMVHLTRFYSETDERDKIGPCSPHLTIHCTKWIFFPPVLTF